MPFTDEEVQSLLALTGIGKTILQRLQQMGLDDVAKLAAIWTIFWNRAHN